MATYGYRWADGTVSICNAKNKEEAIDLLDELGGADPKYLFRIKSPLLITLKADVSAGWLVDQDGFGERFGLDLEERSYPRYYRAYMESLDNWDGTLESLAKNPVLKKGLDDALKEDVEEAKRQNKSGPELPNSPVQFARGLPGQNN